MISDMKLYRLYSFVLLISVSYCLFFNGNALFLKLVVHVCISLFTLVAGVFVFDFFNCLSCRATEACMGVTLQDMTSAAVMFFFDVFSPNHFDGWYCYAVLWRLLIRAVVTVDNLRIWGHGSDQPQDQLGDKLQDQLESSMVRPLVL